MAESKEYRGELSIWNLKFSLVLSGGVDVGKRGGRVADGSNIGSAFRRRG